MKSMGAKILNNLQIIDYTTGYQTEAPKSNSPNPHPNICWVTYPIPQHSCVQCLFGLMTEKSSKHHIACPSVQQIHLFGIFTAHQTNNAVNALMSFHHHEVPFLLSSPFHYSNLQLQSAPQTVRMCLMHSRGRPDNWMSPYLHNMQIWRAAWPHYMQNHIPGHIKHDPAHAHPLPSQDRTTHYLASWARTGKVLAQCWQHWVGTGLILAPCGMFNLQWPSDAIYGERELS